jgi:CRP/FNR family transcriptional regulator, cyclic AMP receptor protein
MSLSKTDKLNFRILDRPDIPVRNYAAGEAIIKVGEPAREMFLLRKGKVAISVHDRTIEEIGPGGIFGEMALIDRASRSANAVAAEDSEVVPIDERLFIILVQDTPYFALDVMRVLAKRLRAMNKLV